MKTCDLLVIGNSAAAVGAVEYFRRYDGTSSITMVSEEEFPSYSKHLISYYLSNEKRPEDLLYRPQDFYLKHRADVLLGLKVEEVDYDARVASLSDGSAIAFKKLLLAVGGRPVIPPIANRDLEGVFSFTRMTEARALKQYLNPGHRVVVIGGGLIGLQVAEALAKLSCQVTVVELMERVLKPVLDRATSQRVQAILEENGINVRTSTAAKEIIPDAENPQRVGGVLTSDGEKISADAVVMCVGVVPRTELAGKRLKVNRGIVVDDRMETSEPGVYAAGDVAEATDFLSGGKRVLAIWPLAYTQGKIAGKNLAGHAAIYDGGINMNAAHFFGWSVASAGNYDPADADKYEILVSEKDGYYKKLVLKDGVLVGFITAGPAVDRCGILLGLIKNRARIKEYAADLLKANELAILPDDIRRARLLGRETA